MLDGFEAGFDLHVEPGRSRDRPRVLGADGERVALPLDLPSEDLRRNREVEDDDVGHDNCDDAVHPSQPNVRVAAS